MLSLEEMEHLISMFFFFKALNVIFSILSHYLVWLWTALLAWEVFNFEMSDEDKNDGNS